MSMVVEISLMAHLPSFASKSSSCCSLAVSSGSLVLVTVTSFCFWIFCAKGASAYGGKELLFVSETVLLLIYQAYF
ncbi:MAG: hypothetical protein AAB568_02495 [Patescibacteria group bacterium]